MELLVPFSTPIIVSPVEGVEALNAALARALIEESESSPGVRVAEHGGGWHSEPDLATRAEPPFSDAVDMLLFHLEEAVRNLAIRRGHDPVPPIELSMRAWATVMRDGDYVSHHDHEDAAFAATYYVDAGDGDEWDYPWSGRLSFVEPNRVSAATMGLDLFPAELNVKPETATMFIYPGYLQHYVHSYRGVRPRIALNAAIRVKALGAAGQRGAYPRAP